MNKKELLNQLDQERQKSIAILQDLSDQDLLTPHVVGDWSIKETLDHLTRWEGQLVSLLFQVNQGVAQPTSAHFGPESVDVLNQRWREAGKDRDLEMVWQDWVNVRKQIIRRVNEINEKDLNAPRRFAWLKGKTLSQWILEDTVQHEEEHMQAIRAWINQQALPGDFASLN